MNINSVADLETLIKMLRKQYVDIIKIDSIEIVLGKVPDKAAKSKSMAKATSSAYDLGNIDENVNIPISDLVIPTDELTDDQKMFGSSDPAVWETSQ
jgi:hypothetical protein